jgi:hypothetical protein
MEGDALVRVVGLEHGGRDASSRGCTWRAALRSGSGVGSALVAQARWRSAAGGGASVTGAANAPALALYEGASASGG